MNDGIYRLKLTEHIDDPAWEFGYNFAAAKYTVELSDYSRRLLALSDDWLDYCLATLKVSPKLAFFGGAVFDEAIRKSLIPSLDKISISREVSECAEGKTRSHSYIFHEQDLRDVQQRMDQAFRLERASDSLSRAQLSAIIAEFEFFMVRLAQISASHNPGKFINGQETVSLGSLLEAKSIEDIISLKVERKIRDEMRGSHDAVIKWMVEVLEIGDLKPVIESIYYKDFMEACQRRHILAHNGGIVNDQYIFKCTDYGLSAKELPPLGAKVQMTPEYLKRVSGRAFLLGLFVIHMKVQKLGSEHRIASLESLLEVSHEFLVNSQTKMCVRVLDFAESKSSDIPANLKLCFAVNRALAALHDPKKSKSEQTAAASAVLKKYDWSVTTPVFDLALACLRRDFSNLLPLARAAHASGLGFVSASTFYVFKEARKIDGFMDCFPKRPLMLPTNDVDDVEAE